MNYSENILGTIGDTPLVKLNKIVEGIDALVLAKVETFNPGNSTKDRMALKMVEDAEKAGILKPGGKLYCFIPFMQPFHASPYDFQRFTYEGMKQQFKDFKIISLKSVGPTSGMLWVLQEWFALVFSFGIKPLHTLLYLFFMVVTFPIKFLDVILQFHPMSKNMASGFSILVEKKQD